MLIKVYRSAFFFLICTLFLFSSINAASLYPIIKKPIEIRLTAKVVPSSVVKMAIYNGVENSIVLEPGTLFQLKEQNIPDINFMDEKELRLSIPIAIIRNDSVEKELLIEIIARLDDINVGESVDRLFISNNPEEVNHSGLLLKGTMQEEKTGVLLFYHKNLSDANKDVIFSVTNHENHPVWIYVTPGMGGPSEDGVFVGHLATKRYFQNFMGKTGAFLYIPALSTRVVYKNAAKIKQIVAGVFRIEKLSPGRISLYTMMVDKQTESVAQYVCFEKEEKGHVGGIFTGGYKLIDKKYVIGNDILNIRVGDSPFLCDELTNSYLLGNYGLTYKLNIELINNYKELKKISLFFVPSGGIARGVFLYEKNIIETGVVNPMFSNDNAKIISVEVEPFQRKNISLITMPQPGSFYPVNLVLKTEE
ncbi:MAG: hypothetical protein DKM50_03100 [Candidatus Margulisiibacteriota bacterium]|nr:MAG: hypothetical protein A2X43_09795 [Candidatus Margulisbacteria bacterium GWD2_39_127]OGI04585.1 MAG: hypothetical protein A2X42_07735 [Candidatus Margulisbacteria bacterium GWF2_38_17]OGI11883.1 MAG: hypothetical protein A2X41_11535 [Candidatus Margulisbacteria bacterium GWE2_39_32]PZM83105.1 MAG: hypothetical protein DKM50_03100 [Candidatus Margulisiibacteriota bacterium]HAR62228.1 hypothetical protein [Candidatus Margulisiibacteriota bacterium]